MKRFYSFFAMIIALMIPIAVQAQNVPITLTFNEAAGASLMIDYQPVEIHDGVNSFSVPEYTSVKVIPNNGYTMKMTNNAGTPLEAYWDGAYIVYPNLSVPDRDWIVTTTKIVKDRSVKVYIDDVTKGQIQLNGSNEIITLTEPETTVEYASAQTTMLYVMEGENSFYSVTYDGIDEYGDPYTERKAYKSDGSYPIYLQDVSAIHINTKYPDIDCKAKFTFVNPGTEGFLTSVKVNDVTVAPEAYLADNYTVKAGSVVKFDFNTNLYRCDYGGFTINGEIAYVYNGYEYTVNGDTEFKFDATKLATYTATVNVTGAKGLNAYLAYNPYTLTEGANTVEFTADGNYLSVSAKGGYQLNSFTVNGEAREGYAYLNEGDVVNIVVAEKTYDNTMYVYLNRDVNSFTYFNFQNSNRESMSLQAGYNKVGFAAADAPFMINFYQPGLTEYYYLNDEPIVMTMYAYDFTPRNGDVVKIFYATEAPAKYDVTFNASAASNFTVKHDIIKTIDDLSAAKQCFEGTQFDIEGANLVVKVNGTPVPAVDGKHTFVINSNTNVSIEGDTQNALGIISAESASAPVYNLQGVKVATSEAFSSLPAGLYIVGGKKVVKK